MKVVHYRHGTAAHYGMVAPDGVVPFALRADATPDELMTFLNDASGTALASSEPVSWDDIQILPPVTQPGKILCVGLNYRRHILEAGHKIPEYPTLFLRFADTLVEHEGNLVKTPHSEQFDYEGELAVIIGTGGSDVDEATAESMIAGYVCLNDGSVRDWQHHTSQWVPGKNFASTAGFGPWMVTPDEVGSLDDLILSTRVNGEERQRTELGDMVFKVPYLISYISQFTTLSPGDVIATGTPSGVGAFTDPPKFLEVGDTVEVEIDRIGLLRNVVTTA